MERNQDRKFRRNGPHHVIIAAERNYSRPAGRLAATAHWPACRVARPCPLPPRPGGRGVPRPSRRTMTSALRRVLFMECVEVWLKTGGGIRGGALVVRNRDRQQRLPRLELGRHMRRSPPLARAAREYPPDACFHLFAGARSVMGTNMGMGNTELTYAPAPPSPRTRISSRSRARRRSRTAE